MFDEILNLAFNIALIYVFLLPLSMYLYKQEMHTFERFHLLEFKEMPDKGVMDQMRETKRFDYAKTLIGGYVLTFLAGSVFLSFQEVVKYGFAY